MKEREYNKSLNENFFLDYNRILVVFFVMVLTNHQIVLRHNTSRTRRSNRLLETKMLDFVV